MHNGSKKSEKPKDLKKTLRQLGALLKPYWVKITVVMFFAIASTAFAIASPRILGNATNIIVEDFVAMIKTPPTAPVQPVFHFDAIRDIIVFLLVLYIISAIFNYIQGWVMTDVTQKITYDLRKDISEKINRLPLKYFDKRTHGEILSRVTNDVETVSQTLNQSLTQIVTSVVMIIGILIMMLSISWLLTLVALIILPISLSLIKFITKRSQIYFVRQQELLGDVNGHIEEMYAGHQVMRVFNGEKSSVKKFDAINQKLYESAWNAQFLSGLMHPLMTFVGNLGYVGVAVIGGWRAINGHLQIGDIQAFIQYVNQFNQPIAQTANIMNILQSTVASSERVFEFLEEPEQSLDPAKPQKIKSTTGEVVFDNVVFGYDPKKPVIKGLSVSIKPGQRVAIVGPTGAGKTTLVNLLMRFYEVDEGKITIDGVDTKQMRRADVRKMFGMVLQDTWLFNGTIRDNITYGAPKATFEEVVETAKEAHVDYFVRSLPGGYDMELNEDADNNPKPRAHIYFANYATI